MLRQNAKLLCALILLPLAALLTGCATPSIPSVQSCPALPSMPAAATPQPSHPYLQMWNGLAETWQKRLKDMQVIR